MSSVRPRKFRVVHLEDSPLDCELVAAALERDHLSVDLVCVSKKQEFERALRDANPDLVLSDFALPGYDGMRALAARNEIAPLVPFIFVSGAIGEERAIEALQQGATDYVLKTRLERLGSAVRRAMQEAEDKHARRAAEQERDRLLEAERRARRDAENANRAKDEFLAVVSHELRTPLNAILGWAKLLRTGPQDPPMIDRGLATIERNALAQARLIDDVLDVTRIMTGKLRLELRNVRAAAVIEAAVESVRPHAAAKGVTIELEVAEECGAVVADPERLQQIVWNLVSNAAKFSPNGAVVRVKAWRRDGALEVEIQDQGAGIAPEALPHVFDRFYQADSAPLTRKQRGLGLGLAIVKNLVEMHGGAVGAASDGLGKGARFSVRIPIPPLLPAAAEARETGDTPAPSSIDGLSILIVDDEPDHRELLKTVLEAQGAKVKTAESAFAALDALVHDRPEVVVSDVGMPHMDGYSLVRRVRALQTQPAAVIALTAFAREEDRKTALEAGFDLYFTKPVDPAELVTSIARVVRRSSRRPGLVGEVA